MTKRELLSAISHLSDNDAVAIQLHSHRLRDGKPIAIQKISATKDFALLEAHDQDQPILEPLKLLKKANHA